MRAVAQEMIVDEQNKKWLSNGGGDTVPSCQLNKKMEIKKQYLSRNNCGRQKMNALARPLLQITTAARLGWAVAAIIEPDIELIQFLPKFKV